jgi:hypothetical protein
MPVAIKGSSGGSVTLSAANASSDTTLTLPNTDGSVLVAPGGILPVTAGGTGAATLTANAVLIGNGTSAVTAVAPSTNGNILTSNGTTWTSAAPATPAAPAALSTASGSAPSYSARAWVNFNGQGTVAIRASGNVSSISDNGTGLYAVNFTTAMPDADYTSIAMASPIFGSAYVLQSINNSGTSEVAPTASAFSFGVNNSAGTASDPKYASVVILR